MFLLRLFGFSAIAGAVVLRHVIEKEDERKARRKFSVSPPLGSIPPTRKSLLSKLKNKPREYDMIIVGGGSVGAGCALDAATRGYSVLLLEKNDFSSGTSSKSTKLIHGGIRYLEKAIKELDYKQLSLVVEGLRERKAFLTTVPYLTREVGILLPIKNKYMIPYFWMGTKMYDWLSGRYGIQKSYFLSKQKIASTFPSINVQKIAGGMVYFDGQMKDARVNAMLVETAVHYGADVLNYAEVKNLKKNNGKIHGVDFIDQETQEAYSVQCKGVINATGPCSDILRTKDDTKTKKIMAPSIGVHLVLGKGYTGKIGLLNPSTKNGSVLFLLPWNSVSIVGTTDTFADDIHNPKAKATDAKYILREMSEFVDAKLKPKAKNILSMWAGIRPLARDVKEKGQKTESLVRSHLIETSSSGMVSIVGGKWTSYREMAEETVTHSASVFSLPKRECVTKYVKLLGSHGYTKNLSVGLAREFGVPEDIADHLVSTYGDRARRVCMYAEGAYSRIHPLHPYIKAEIEYGITHEHVRKISDFVGRRSLFAYLDVRSAHASVYKIGEEFKKHLRWTRYRLKEEIEDAFSYLDTMGYSLLKELEKNEEVFSKLKQDLRSTCVSSICKPLQISSLIDKYFKGYSKDALFSSFRGRTEVPIAEVLSILTESLDILE